MNINQAKQDIKHTIAAYQSKDEYGSYKIPIAQQRPLLLMGPPGIGKTAIVEQIAKELDLGLVSYTITHHTRQSAVGLPKIVEMSYKEKSYSATEYTMSEIVAAVYECMKRTGKEEGILFIDEINCVSETLTPTMLQFLQKKTFGSHQIPKGYVIVAAGNPEEYNRTARNFDIVTLDRVRTMEIDADLDCWMEYATEKGVHGGILSYLKLRREDFYFVEATKEEDQKRKFVTARGWEDLSQLIKIYEEMDIPLTVQQIQQYIQFPEVAKRFGDYYELYRKYGQDYDISGILTGESQAETAKILTGESQAESAKNLTGESQTEPAKKLLGAGFEERMAVVGLLFDGLMGYLRGYGRREEEISKLAGKFQGLKGELEMKTDADLISVIDGFIERQKKALQAKVDYEIISEEDEKAEKYLLKMLEDLEKELKGSYVREKDEAVSAIDLFLQREEKKLENQVEIVDKAISRALKFIEESFSGEQEMILFISGLLSSKTAMEYLSKYGNATFLRLSEKLIN